MDSADAIRASYEETDRAYRVLESKIGCVVALILVPAGITLDYFIYPDHLGLFFLLRLICDFFIALNLALHYTAFGQRHIPLITFAWLITVQATIAFMIFLTEGYESTYYAGLNLSMLAVGILLPTSVPEAILFCISTIALYSVACLAHPAEIEFSRFYNNLYFLALTAIISITSVFFNARRRFSEFRLSYQLDERNKQLAELDRLKSQFFANISHELRTPLTLILAPVEDILDKHKELPSHLVDQIGIIKNNGIRLLRLVNDLLDIIRLEEGYAELDRRPLELGALLSGITSAMSPLARSKSLDLVTDLPEEEIWVQGDRSALEKVFLNLLSNAFKFTNNGGRITVTAKPGPTAVHVAVTDTGIGISAAHLPYVFDRFRQADNSATRRYSGTGLGLALVKDITESHGGSAGIRSQVGSGTTVTIKLPMLTKTDAGMGPLETTSHIDTSSAQWLELGLTKEASSQTAESHPAEERDGSTARASVLIVDDEPDMRRYLVDLLSREYRVLQTGDGESCLDIAFRERPDLLVLDLMLPEIDGLEICRRLKDSEDTRSIRIVLLTARADETSKLTALENGADDFLTKPFSGVEVQTRLRNLLRSSKLEGDLQRRNEELRSTLEELQSTQDKLVHSEKLNALGRLSAGLLHEINNPLNYALTALDLARNDPAVTGDEDLKEILGDIDEGMQRIRGIVTELRAFAYPSRGDRHPFDLREAVDSAIQITGHECRGIDILNQVPEGLDVLGSRNHVSQVLINLLTNAARAVRTVSDQRPGEIRIRGEELADGRIRLSVRDNGIGIPAETVEKVFDPFYTTQDVGEGMGMGLSVCQTIVRNHGGELAVRSEHGSWTEFSFDLPPAAWQAAEDDEAERNEHVG